MSELTRKEAAPALGFETFIHLTLAQLCASPQLGAGAAEVSHTWLLLWKNPRSNGGAGPQKEIFTQY